MRPFDPKWHTPCGTVHLKHAYMYNLMHYTFDFLLFFIIFYERFLIVAVSTRHRYQPWCDITVFQ